MTLESKSLISPTLISRVKNLILKPKSEWEAIASAPQPIQPLFMGFVLILAAITPLCHAIRGLVFGYGALGVYYHPDIITVLVGAVVQYVLAVAMVYVLGFIIDALAPRFGGTKDRTLALNVAAYSATAAWLAGIFGLFPQTSALSIVGLYSLYLLYLGLPRLMKAPEEKALGYTAVVVLIAIVLGLVVGVASAGLYRVSGAGPFGALATGHVGPPVSGQVTLNGAPVDVGKLAAASASVKAEADALKAGAPSGSGGPVAAVSADQLKALLPQSLNGFTLTEASSSSAGSAGMGATHAEAQYAKGDASITLSLTDLASAGGLGAMAQAMNVNSSRETATGYEKVETVNGKMTTEEFDRASSSGKYGVLLGGRLMVEARGTHVSIEDLKAAVSAVGPDRLESLAHKG